jgi:hypothetical protein
MTARLLRAFSSLSGPPFLLMVGLGVVVSLLPFTLLVDLALVLRRRAHARRVFALDVVRCPAGHVVELNHGAAWSCESCGLVVEHHPFAACEHCGHIAAGVLCACGRFCPNSLWSGGQ